MSEAMHDHTLFVAAMQHWVDDASDADLDRAWRLTKGCLAVHAVVDRLVGETLTQASNSAWDAFVVAYHGGEATYFMAALAEDLRVAAPVGRDDPMTVAIERAYKASAENPGRKRAKRTNRADSLITPAPGGET